jgi:hypothetical protein
VKIPGLGEVKTPYAVAGGAFILGILGYAYYKNKKSQATAAAAAQTAAFSATGSTDSTGAGTNGIDPNTGVPYADEGTAYGSTYGGIDPATGMPYYDEITQSSTTTNPNTITTNSAWIQQAESDGQNLFGATSALATSAVSKYISQTNAGLNPSEYQLMQSIVAELGQPPEHGPYRLIQASAPQQGTPGTGGGKSISQAVGQVIQVPANIVPPGMSMAKMADAHGISLQHLIDNNPGSGAGTTGVVNVPYLIRPGDTLTSLATIFGLAPEHMAQVLQSQGIS